MGKLKTYTLQSDFRGNIHLQPREEKEKEGVIPKCLLLHSIAHTGVSKDAMVSISWSKTLPSGRQWSSHWDLSTLRYMQRLSKIDVSTVSFEGTDFQVFTLHAYLPNTDLLVSLPVLAWQPLPLTSPPH